MDGSAPVKAAPTIIRLPKQYIGDMMMVAEFLYSFESTLKMEHPPAVDTVPPTTAEEGSVMEAEDAVDNEKTTISPPSQRDCHQMSIMEKVLLALLDPSSTVRYRKILVQLLKPLIVVTYKEASFEAILTSVRASQSPEPAVNPEAAFHLANVSNPNLASTMTVDVCSVTELLLMYIKDNVGAFQQFVIQWSPAEETATDVMVTINKLVKCLASSDEDRLPALDIDMKIKILKFLVVELVGTILVSEQIETRFGKLPEMEKQARRENVEVRLARKDLAGVRREIRTLLAAEENGDESIVEPPPPVAVDSEPVAAMEENASTETGQEATDSSPAVEDSEAATPPVDNETKMKQLMEEEKRLIQKIGRNSDQFPSSLEVATAQDSTDSLNGPLAADSTYHVHEEILKQRMSVRNRGIGRDRHGREYWCFQSLPGIFLYVDEYTNEAEHADFQGVSVEKPSDLEHEWYRFPDSESISSLMKTVDSIGMKFDAERQLKKMLDKWRNVLLENELWTKCGETYSKADISVPETLRVEMVALLESTARRVFMPMFNSPSVFKSFREMLPGLTQWLSTIAALQDGSLPEWKQAVTDLLSVCHRRMDEAVTAVQSKKRKNSKRKASQSAPIPRSELSPLVFCFLDQEAEETRLVDVKAVEKSLLQWKIFVTDSDHMDRLYIAVRMLHDCITANTEGSEVFTANDNADPLAGLIKVVASKNKSTAEESDHEDISHEELEQNGRAKRKKTARRASRK